MKKKINLEHRIDFPTMVGEITAISLEKDLSFTDESTIDGNLILSGKYKLTEASRLEEDFNYKIPISIVLTEKLDITTATIEISNFTYEMKDDAIMNCNIELLIDGLEVLDDRECDGDNMEVEIPVKEEDNKKEVEVMDDNTTNTTDDNIFNINDSADTYGTLLVYIIRDNENLNSIITKYNTSIEELEKYNDLSNIGNGTKLIIPLHE